MLNMSAFELRRLCIVPGNGMGVINLDFGIYPPEDKGGLLEFAANFSESPYGRDMILDLGDGAILNHRYPNKNWWTLTGKVGRKHCRYGRTLAMPFDQMRRIRYLNVGYCAGDRSMAWLGIPFGIDGTLLSDDRPCAAAVCHVMLADPDKPGFDVVWYCRGDDGMWEEHGCHGGGPTVRSQGGNRLPVLAGATDERESGWTMYGGAELITPHAPYEPKQ